MPSLNELKRKIKSIDSTKKITNAMKLVATSKLKKYKSQMLNSRDFLSNFYDVFSLVKENSDQFTNEADNQKSTLWILFGSSLGLAGSFNLNVVKELKKHYGPDDQIIVIGKRSLPSIRSKIHDAKILFTLDLDDREIDFALFVELAQKIASDFKNSKFKNIKIVYTQFINSITFEGKVFSLVPFDEGLSRRMEKPLRGGYYTIEPDQKELFDGIFISYLSITLFGAFLESKVSENGSRRNAMDSATKNADSLSEDYVKKYNSVRQSKITQEINEIVSGSNIGDNNE